MRHLAVAFAVSVVPIAAMGAARASVVVTIDKSQQLMSVAVDGATRYNWPVSTARAGYSTPNGTYRPQMLARSWFSRKYYNSPMPHSIFFHGGYAIHGSYEISRLGGPASHGCVRLHPSHAATLFALVKSQQSSTRIVVTGTTASARVARPHLQQQEINYAPARPDYAPPGSYQPYGAYPAAPAPGMWWPSR
jgi:lipoprotein-anchoring transpeptidase ErfK/SrfK